MAQSQEAEDGHAAAADAGVPLGGSHGGSPPLAETPLGVSPGVLAGKPPRPNPAIKMAAAEDAAQEAAAGGPAAAADSAEAAAAAAPAAGPSGRPQRPPGVASEGLLTFGSPFDVAQELRQGGAPPQQQPGDPRPGGVLRTSSSGVSEPQPGRMRRTVSWSDMDNRAPLTQVVEYEPSEVHSVHSDDWSTSSSGCICCIQ